MDNMDNWVVLYEKMDTLLDFVRYLCEICGIGFGLTMLAVWIGGKRDE